MQHWPERGSGISVSHSTGALNVAGLSKNETKASSLEQLEGDRTEINEVSPCYFHIGSTEKWDVEKARISKG